ncbi:hypothetical protein C8J57DRAFT_1449933 [Mycena rebaudengoi]|nr:hypothetical protein C8J57DRAFT_1449933 [Mycena rebaudengoi]
MFIGEGLRNYFSEFGKVDACTIMRDPAGTSRGFAFMTFEDPAAVATVLGREHFLDGKVRGRSTKRAIPREEHLAGRRHGKVVDTTVMVGRESSRSKGFGFVTFEDATNTDQLVGKLGLRLDVKSLGTLQGVVKHCKLISVFPTYQGRSELN